jgi:hypothetical protein
MMSRNRCTLRFERPFRVNPAGYRLLRLCNVATLNLPVWPPSSGLRYCHRLPRWPEWR